MWVDLWLTRWYVVMVCRHLIRHLFYNLLFCCLINFFQALTCRRPLHSLRPLCLWSFIIQMAVTRSVCVAQDRWHSGEWHCPHVTAHAHRSNVSTAASAGFHGTAHNVTTYTFLDTPLRTRPRECRPSFLCPAFLLLAGFPPLRGLQNSDLQVAGILGPGFSPQLTLGWWHGFRWGAQGQTREWRVESRTVQRKRREPGLPHIGILGPKYGDRAQNRGRKWREQEHSEGPRWDSCWETGPYLAV